MKYEGHFLLWYLILMPFAKLGFPFFTTNIISWLITCIAVWLVLDKAPFKFYKRVLLVFTFPLIYLLPVVSRSYCLIPLAVTLMSIFYKDRKEKPLRYLLSVVLLANTHVIMLGMVGVVLLEFFIELCKDKTSSTKDKKKRIISFIITIILLLISVSPLLGSLETNKDIGFDNSILNKFQIAIFCYPLILFMEIFNYFMGNMIMMAIALILLGFLLFYEIKSYPSVYLKIYLCVLWQCLIYSFIFGPSLQRASTIILIFLYYKWINIDKENKKIKDIDRKIQNILLTVITVLNIIFGILYIAIYEIPYNCSYAYDIGNYINSNLENDSVIISGPRAECASSVIPYINKNIKFYQIIGNRYFTYAILDYENKLDIKPDDIKNLTNIFNNDQKIYYIYCYDKLNIVSSEYNEKDVIDEFVKKGAFKEIYSSGDETLYQERYELYEVYIDKL